MGCVRMEGAIVVNDAFTVVLVVLLVSTAEPLLLKEQTGRLLAVPVPVYDTWQLNEIVPENPFWPATVIVAVFPVVAPGALIVNGDAASVKLVVTATTVKGYVGQDAELYVASPEYRATIWYVPGGRGLVAVQVATPLLSAIGGL